MRSVFRLWLLPAVCAFAVWCQVSSGRTEEVISSYVTFYGFDDNDDGNDGGDELTAMLTYSTISIARVRAQRTSRLSNGALAVLKLIPVMAGSLLTTNGKVG